MMEIEQYLIDDCSPEIQAKIESLQTENTTLKGKLADAEDIIKGVIDDDPYTNHFAKEYTRKHLTPPTTEE
jgi:hypothetical protein